TPEVQELKLGEMVLAKEQLPRDTSKFDLTLFVVETPNGLQCSIEYATDLFTEPTIRKLVVHYKLVLESITKTPDEKVGSLKMITWTEEQQVIYDFNQTEAEYPSTKSVIEFFEEQVLKTPEATALLIGEDRLSYYEVNQKANQLASYLKSKGVANESLVPICVERGFMMVIGVIGIMKTGAAYVPIDPEYPAERIAFMLDDSKAQVVIVSESTSSILQAQENVEVILLDNHASVLNFQSVENLGVDIHPDDLVYVLYTSGSTGRPKGVKMPGGGMVNLLCWQQKQFGSNKRRVLQFASLNFDVSFQEIFSTLCFGSTLVLITSETRREIPEIIRVLEKQQVTHLFIPFIVLKSLVEYIKSLSETSFKLEEIIVAGEQLKFTEDISQFIKTGNIRLVNQYGPTEAHVVTSYNVDAGSLVNPLPPIGKPIDNTQIYILNQHQKHLPVNVPGEIYIGGVQVARGYLNNEKLTAAKFLADVFSDVGGGRMYRTGDLGRWLPNGNIQFLGRIDAQVKVRGYRIELGEIETVLHQHPGVRQAAVVAVEEKNGNNRLIGYVTPVGIFDKQAIIQYLKKRLPDFMVPSLWVEMEKLPVTANGKVDRKALPDPDASELLTNTYAAPRNETEAELAAIWRELLAVEQVGIHNNFFELGGHSLMAIRVISAIRKRMDLELTIKDLFTYTTVAELATHLSKQSVGNSIPPLERHSRPDHIPLSFSQERLWFIDQLEGSVQYHLSTVLRLKGDLDVSALNNAFRTVFDRHEVLRSVIYQVDGKPFIRIKDHNDLEISMIDDFSGREANKELRQYISRLVNKPFDLSRDNMLRASLIRVTDDEQILVVTMHHIASDGWSISILVKEVVELYESFVQRRTAELPPLEIQYSDYAIWQKDFLQGEVLDRKLEYWKQKLSGVAPLQLPTDYARPVVRSVNGATLRFTIDKELTDLLHKFSQENGVTVFMTLLSAFNVLMHRYSNQEDICVGTPVAGRQHEQLENLIGFFINTLALRSEVTGNSSFQDLVKQVRQTTLEAYEHQEVPFEKIVEAVVTERDMSRTPLFQVMFVFQNTPSVPALKLGEVQLTAVDHSYSTTQFDLSFIITEISNGLQGSVNYSTDLFDQATIDGMVSHFRQLLSAVVTQPQQAVGLLSMLSKKEEAEVLYGFNNTKVDYPSNKNINHLFEEQVRMKPHNKALIFENDVLTYAQLNERANQLAHYLASKGVTTETLVPICMEKSADLMIGILAILKAGGAYVPLDSSYPAER
ncbi:MAG TPA: amino acid adenylation domain-containing protein, partial [Flavitalea sp.]|nr:amino acid adenylation domain-containing protein [Flavitalea sp.]